MKKYNQTIYISLILISISITIRAQEDYFPPNLWRSDSFNKFIVDWYSEYLTVLNEPSFWKLSQINSEETYRFLWLRTFHEPVSIRLEIITNQSAKIVVKQSNGLGGYEPGKLVLNDTIMISPKELNHFYTLIDTSNFWNLPVNPDPNWIGEDGSQWIIEGIKNNNYHLVDMWSPYDSAFRTLGLYLIELSKLKPKNIY